jgi:dihydrofolate synthase/folylpolyglutamate synthase
MTATRAIFHDRQSALAFLLGRIDYERTQKVPYRSRDFKLDRMRDLMARLGNPQESYRAVHIAGTKGKGSTAVMVAAILSAAGYRTGLYTSPHLEQLEERFVIDGQQCPEADLVRLLGRIHPEVLELDQRAVANGNRPGPTYFEITTAAALLYFQWQQVDCAVLEVGLGGRLDSTNVCRSAVSIITSISLDHMRQLGNTLAAIAREKAGIIRPGVPVVSGVLQDEPQQVIRQIASERRAQLLHLNHDFGFRSRPAPQAEPSDAAANALTDPTNRFTYWEQVDGVSFELPEVQTPMLGRHQAANASVALAAVRQLQRDGWHVPSDAVRRGLSQATCPARIEVACLRPQIILDAGHNRASIEALLEVLKARTVHGQRILVFATSVDKDIHGMLAELLPQFDHIVLTRYLNNPRAVDPVTMEQLCRQICSETGSGMPSLQVCVDPAEAWDVIKSRAKPADLVCVTGSFFLAAEIRPHLAKFGSELPMSRSL